MKLSLNWLSERLDLSCYTIDQLSDLLTFAGVEVEGVEHRGVPSDLIVVAEVKEKTPHPNADKLNVCMVDAGEGSLRQIVCGARNYEIGDKVPCALPGADLGGGFLIKDGVLRGVESKGMLCGASEIGLVDEEDGLMILSRDQVVGTQLNALYAGDTILDLEVTPNRPDCLSHSGMARELGAIIGQQPKPLPYEIASERDVLTDSEEVEVLESAACPYYSFTRVNGVKVEPSPEWLVEKLESIGLKTINTVVDITNYVLHETGQPLHAFDASRVSGAIVVKNASEGEVFKGLDEKEYSLFADDCVISDQTGQPLALAGVLGGLESGVTLETQDIILEAAYFTPSRVRRTARRLGNLTTDSSYRFERGVDFESIEHARDLALALIAQLAGGVAQATVVSGKLPEALPALTLPQELLDRVTGGNIEMETAEGHLKALGLDKNGEEWLIPAYRQDLIRPIDLVEEIVRLEGLDKISSKVSSVVVLPSKEDVIYDGTMAIKRHLVGQGFYEANTIKLIAETALDPSIASLESALPIKPMLEGDLIKVALPLSADHSVMRPSLTPGLIASATRNARQGAKSLCLFESGRVFRNAGGGKAKDLESDHIALLLSGCRTGKGWNTSEEVYDAFDLKGVISSLAPNADIQLKPRDKKGFLLGAEVLLNGKNIGAFAQLHPQMQRSCDISHPVYLVELDLGKLIQYRNTPKKATALPRYQGSSRDIALECPLTVSAAQIEEVIKKKNEPLLVGYTCFDFFYDPTGEKLSADRKSLAFRLDYRSSEKSLKAKEVEAAHSALVKAVCDKLKLEQR